MGFSTSNRRGSTPASSVWDVATRQCRGVLSGHQSKGVYPAITQDGALIATIGEDARVILWDARSLKRIRVFETAYNSFAGAFSPDGRRLAVGRSSADMAGAVSIFDVETGMGLIDLATEQEYHYAVGWSPDGTLLMARTADGIIWRAARAQD